VLDGRFAEARPRERKARTILLISADYKLGENLRSVANLDGRIVVRVDGTADVSQIVYIVQPAVVLLDLDLPAGAAWSEADALLQQHLSPPIILLTARTQPYDIRTAIGPGLLADKSADPTRLLGIVQQTFQASALCQAERKAIQRLVIRWLRPSVGQLAL
jgi:DNA-binding response OmpR family regulator